VTPWLPHMILWRNWEKAGNPLVLSGFWPPPEPAFTETWGWISKFRVDICCIGSTKYLKTKVVKYGKIWPVLMLRSQQKRCKFLTQVHPDVNAQTRMVANDAHYRQAKNSSGSHSDVFGDIHRTLWAYGWCYEPKHECVWCSDVCGISTTSIKQK